MEARVPGGVVLLAHSVVVAARDEVPSVVVRDGEHRVILRLQIGVLVGTPRAHRVVSALELSTPARWLQRIIAPSLRSRQSLERRARRTPAAGATR